jgi:dCMP deaminase
MNEEKKRLFDERYLRMAFIWSENSYAIRRKVGCLIVKNNSIISDGYNGTPSGFENVCERLAGMRVDSTLEELKEANLKGIELVTKPYVLHAEANAITKLSKSNQSSEGATAYITDAPCIECSKLIIQAGIKRVVYAREYRVTEGIDLLKRAGVQVDYIPINKDNK